MRPVAKGAALNYKDGDPHRNARPGLIARLGFYCSYCERQLGFGLQVEHIRARTQSGADSWANFLLACGTCNPTKGRWDPDYGSWLIPDRDNTARAFSYRMDGVIEVRKGLTNTERQLAEATLGLIDLNQELTTHLDDAGNTIPLDRRKQRLEAWATAQRYRTLWERNRTFSGVPEMRRLLVERFAGTEKACFDPSTMEPAGIHPNPDRLAAGGKL